MLTSNIFRTFLFLLSMTLMSSAWLMLHKIHYSIDPASHLSLDGSSNVTDFSCDCNQEFSGDEVTFQEDEINGILTFQGAVLHVKTKNLDCGNKGMNRDMYNTLMADKYPHISIQLISAKLPSNTAFNQSGQTVGLTTKVALTIAGSRKIMPLAVEAIMLNNDKYQFKSCQLIRMTDFGIDPPQPFFGMIKVSDEITINMDLIIRKV
jgi:polyisoprenoid-binding protein YceI